MLTPIAWGDDETKVPHSRACCTRSRRTSARVCSMSTPTVRPSSLTCSQVRLVSLAEELQVCQTLHRSVRRRRDSWFLDYFAGSGNDRPRRHQPEPRGRRRRKFILVEMGDYFDTVLLPRLKKVTFTPEWKDGKPSARHARGSRAQPAHHQGRPPRILRGRAQQPGDCAAPTRSKPARRSPRRRARTGSRSSTCSATCSTWRRAAASRCSTSQAFTDPTAYKLKVKRPGSDESREVNVDLLETFNWLIGLTVQHIAAPQTFSAAFERDSEKRLRLKGRSSRSRRAVVVPHRHRHHARRAQDARHLAQAHRRSPSRAGQPGARRVVHEAGLLEPRTASSTSSTSTATTTWRTSRRPTTPGRCG